MQKLLTFKKTLFVLKVTWVKGWSKGEEMSFTPKEGEFHSDLLRCPESQEWREQLLNTT